MRLLSYSQYYKAHFILLYGQEEAVDGGGLEEAAYLAIFF